MGRTVGQGMSLTLSGKNRTRLHTLTCRIPPGPVPTSLPTTMSPLSSPMRTLSQPNASAAAMAAWVQSVGQASGIGPECPEWVTQIQ